MYTYVPEGVEIFVRLDINSAAVSDTNWTGGGKVETRQRAVLACVCVTYKPATAGTAGAVHAINTAMSKSCTCHWVLPHGADTLLDGVSR